MGIIALTLIPQIMIVEFHGKFAKAVKLNWQLWLAYHWFKTSISCPLAALGMLIPVPKTPLSKYLKCRRFHQRILHSKINLPSTPLPLSPFWLLKFYNAFEEH